MLMQTSCQLRALIWDLVRALGPERLDLLGAFLAFGSTLYATCRA